MIFSDRIFIIIISTILAVLLPILTITTGFHFYSLLIILLLLGHKFIGSPIRLYIFALFCAAIELKAPIGRFMMSDLLYILAIFIIILNLALNKIHKQFDHKLLNKVIFFFILNLFIIMSFRGTGLLILGDTKVGGGAYILWIVCLSALFFCKYINLSIKQAKFLIIGWTTFPLLNPLMEFLTIKTGGSIYFFTKYFNINFGQLYQRIVVNNTDMARTGTMPISIFFQIIGLIILSKKQNLFIFSLFTLFGAIAIMFSGFRSYLVAYLMVSIISAFFLYNKKNQLFALGGLIVVITFISLALFIDQLPFSIQRAVSFIPGLRVDGIAMDNALDTTTWRIEIWIMALNDFWNYAIIGRGLAWDTTAWVNLAGRTVYSTPEFYYINHNYHSGPVTALIDYGIIGTILWIIIQFSVAGKIRESFKPALNYSQSSTICTFYIYGCIFVFWDIFHFWFIYGQTSGMQKSVSYFILMLILKNVVDKIIQKKNKIKIN